MHMRTHCGDMPQSELNCTSWASSASKRSDLAGNSESFPFFLLIIPVTYDLRRCGTIYLAGVEPGGVVGFFFNYNLAMEQRNGPLK
jgi:hypothetical protein